MYGSGSMLPVTGGIVIGGVAMDQVGIALLVVGGILVAATIVRFRFRRDKTALDA